MAHRFDPKKVHKLDNPERRKLLPPEEILAPLQIGEQEDVADIGVGPGYFAIPASRLTSGTVYGVDVEPQMLGFLKEKANEAGAANIVPVQSDAEAIDLADGSVDKVFCAFILHELADLTKGLSEIKRILRPGGKLLVLEWEKKQTESGPPVEERLDAPELAASIEKFGFATEIIRPNPNHYMILGTQTT
ncbi:class I SAM-dependent methyltransferase [Effusibacillus lacus]|uniref:Methyltransferase type 11 n=1 Tax=Effusibacillus lacus TaxID=1348429 RepID=A0A292YL18_9BACL|nr:class I SAM-dependent methyltransferase [Effusibacillus lacus]TCS71240.1 methyltransferase family protein [Effusibacillus lacus]GAX89866.1 methyltransferase type 11 [Effusibacillus lacus]